MDHVQPEAAREVERLIGEGTERFQPVGGTASSTGLGRRKAVSEQGLDLGRGPLEARYNRRSVANRAA